MPTYNGSDYAWAHNQGPPAPKTASPAGRMGTVLDQHPHAPFSSLFPDWRPKQHDSLHSLDNATTSGSALSTAKQERLEGPMVNAKLCRMLTWGRVTKRARLVLSHVFHGALM